MDGTPYRIVLHVVVGTASFAAACSGLDPEPAPMPHEMFDSPTIAGEFSESKEPDETSSESDDSSNSEETSDEPPSDRNRTEPDGSGRPLLSPEAARHRTPDPVEDRTKTEPSPGAHPTAARFVTAMYELNGVAMPDPTQRDIRALYRHCRDRDAVFRDGSPAAGDLAFFHNVVDADDDGRNDDWFTLVAMVEEVHDSGRVDLLTYRDGRVREFAMNREQPSRPSRADHRLRVPDDDDPPFTRYLAGELFAGYCELLGDRSKLLVVDNWQPGMELDGAPE